MEFYPSQEFVSNPSNIFHGQSSLMEILNVGSSLIQVTKSETTKSVTACKNHSEAERRRRKRINGHLSTLRTLLPNTIKTDKASLLAEVVRRVKELKEATSELTGTTNIVCCSSSNNKNNITAKEHMVPSETDELHLLYSDQHYGTIKAVMCCEDRPELMSDLTRALNSVQVNIIRAEMSTIGGRTKIVFWLLQSSFARDEDLAAMRRALVTVMDGDAVVLPESDKNLPGGKRLRVCKY